MTVGRGRWIADIEALRFRASALWGCRSFNRMPLLTGAVLSMIPPFILASGCQVYEPSPPDLARHYTRWMERSSDSEPVAAFAARIAEIDRAPVAFDPSDGITLAEAELIALVYNADLRIARVRAGIAQAGSDNAGLWMDPTFGVNLTRILASVDHPWMAMTSVGITIPVSGTPRFERSLAEGALDAAIHQIAEREWTVRSMLRERWIEWSAARAQIEVVSTYLQDLEELIRIVDHIEAVGEFTRIESRLFHIERVSQRNELRRLEADRERAELDIRRLMGLSPYAPVELHPRLQVGRDEDVSSGSPLSAAGVSGSMMPNSESEAFVPFMLQRNPTLRQLHAEHEVAERQLSLEIRRQFPDLMLGPGYGYEGGTSRLILGFSVPLPILNANRRAIAEAAASRVLARAALETTLEELISEYEVQRVMRDSADDRRRRLEREIIPLVDAQFSDARRIAELGEVDTFLLLETLRRRLEAKRELIDLIAAEGAAAVRMERLIGPDAGLETLQRENAEPGSSTTPDITRS